MRQYTNGEQNMKEVGLTLNLWLPRILPILSKRLHDPPPVLVHDPLRIRISQIHQPRKPIRPLPRKY